MKYSKLDGKALDTIIDNMIVTVDSSKADIFEIGEQCRQDFERISTELKEIKALVHKVIFDGDELEKEAKASRQRLSEVSSRFKEFSEDQVREAYEKAHMLQVDLTLNRQHEKQLRKRRDDLERRLLVVQETIQRAEHLVSQISVVLNYLTSDLRQMSEVFDMYKQKQDFGFKIIEAQEEERKKLSREIHDGPAQMLANVIVRSDLVERTFNERGTNQALVEIKELKRMVRDALYEVRKIIYDLRPMALDDLGLVPTLRKYLSTIEEYNKSTRILFTVVGIEKRLPPKYEVALFRLAQESVQNAMKHAESNEIQVKLQLTDEKGTLSIRDNGKGFETSLKNEKSYGIMGMRERVDILEGEIDITSSRGSGTLVFIQIPLRFESTNNTI